MPPLTQQTFTWFCQDPDWKNKFLIGSLMFLAGTIVPLVGWLGAIIALGYSVAVWRAILRDEPPRLPDWDHYEHFFLDGLKAILAGVLYLLPIFALVALALLFLFGGLTLAILADANGDAPAAQTLVPFLIGYAGFFVLIFVISLLSVFLAVPYAIAIGQYVRTGQVSAGYRVGQVWRIFRANAGGFIGAFATHWALGIALSCVTFALYLTIILCLLNQFVLAPTLFYQILMWAFLFAHAYRRAVQNLGAEALAK